METIEDAAIEYVISLNNDSCSLSKKEVDEYAEIDFKKGVEFSQRWIDCNNEPIPKDTVILSMSASNTTCISLVYWNKEKLKFCPIANGISLSDYGIENITHWRPITLK